MSQEDSEFPISFSQIDMKDEFSSPPSPKAAEKHRLSEMDASSRSRIITDLSRYILFKALSGEPIDRSKLAKEAFPDNLQDRRVTNATLMEVRMNLEKVFGFQIRSVPHKIMQNKNMPNKYKDRLIVVNKAMDDEMGSHSKMVHGYHVDSAVEKGLLMLILAFIYCKGEIRDGLRWLDANVLYSLLHSVDENIPATPSQEVRVGRKRESLGRITSPSPGGGDGNSDSGVGMTPNVDLALERFLYMDYLVKKKFDQQGDGTAAVDDAYSYAIGPRALIVVGSRQIVYFCADVLGQQPDPTMLQELEPEELETAHVEPFTDEEAKTN